MMIISNLSGDFFELCLYTSYSNASLNLVFFLFFAHIAPQNPEKKFNIIYPQLY